MAEINLLDVFGEGLDSLRQRLLKVAGEAVVEQLPQVIVPVQRPSGNADDFSVLAITYPGLTSEEKKGLPFLDERSYVIEFTKSETVEFAVDPFGQINWMYVRGSPDIYEHLNALFVRKVQEGGFTPFWKL